MISFLILSGRSFYFHATARPHPALRPPSRHRPPSPRLAPPPHATARPHHTSARFHTPGVRSHAAARPHKAIHAPTPSVHQTAICPRRPAIGEGPRSSTEMK